jgi:hypothetical protein
VAVELLERALLVAARFDRAGAIRPLLTRSRALLQGLAGEAAVVAVELLAAPCLRGLLRLGLRDEADALLTQMADLTLGGRAVADVDPRSPTWPQALQALLPVAGGWYALGRVPEAEPVLEAARAVLSRDDLPYREKSWLAVAYAQTLGRAPVEVAQGRLEELFRKFGGIRDTYTTNSYYSQTQLRVIEAAVLAAVERGLSPPAP